MTKDIKKETKENPEEKKTEVKSEPKNTCGCGCDLPIKKQANL